jgi:hypothetical protein
LLQPSASRRIDQQVVDDHRLVHVQLQMPLARGNADGHVVAQTWQASIDSASHWVGLTLPGMIELPARWPAA